MSTETRYGSTGIGIDSSGTFLSSQGALTNNWAKSQLHQLTTTHSTQAVSGTELLVQTLE